MPPLFDEVDIPALTHGPEYGRKRLVLGHYATPLDFANDCYWDQRAVLTLEQGSKVN